MKLEKLGFFLIAFVMGTLVMFGQGQDSIRAVGGVLTINLVPSQSRYKVFVDQAITSTVFNNPPSAAITITVLFVQDSTGHAVTFTGNISGGCAATGGVSSSASATTGCQFTFDSANNQWSGVGGAPAAVNYIPGCNVTQTTCLGSATTAAVADWRQAATDGTCTNSSNAISWGTPNEITAADVGKAIDIISPGAGGQFLNNGRTTIATVTSSTTGTLSTTTAAGGCGTPVTFFVYTDNGPAFNSIELAIHNSAGHKGIMYFPCGIYGAATAFFSQSGANDTINYWGGGGGHSAAILGQCTIIKVSPVIFSGVSGSGNAALNPASGDMRDITFDGESAIVTATNSDLIRWSGVSAVSNVQLNSFLGTSGNSATLCHVNSDNFTAVNLSCQFKDQKAMACNSLNVNIFNPQFSGNPGLDLADCVGSFNGGVIGLNATGAASALTSAAGSGTVMPNFNGTQFTGNTASPIISITKSGAAATQVNLVGITFNCQHASSQALLNIGANAIVQLSDLGNTNATVTTGCPGTPTIANAGTFIDGGGNGFGMTQMTVAWSGAGSYFMNCSSFSVVPVILTHFNTSGDAVVGSTPCSFNITVGTGVATSTGSITLPNAPAGWNCWAQNQNRAALVLQTANTATSATFTNFGTTFAATNWTNSDTLLVNCNPR